MASASWTSGRRSARSSTDRWSGCPPSRPASPSWWASSPHHGRSILGPGAFPFARLEVGTGNGGAPATDGAVAGRVIGTYIHGPLLAWNPALADHLLGMLVGTPLAPARRRARLCRGGPGAGGWRRPGRRWRNGAAHEAGRAVLRREPQGGGRRSHETPAVARLPGGDLPYTLRRSARARRLRVTIDPRRGVIATVPGSGRGRRRPAASSSRSSPSARRGSGGTSPARRRRAGAAAGAGELGDGSLLRYRGEPHRVRVVAGPPGSRRSRVERVGADDEDVLLVTLAAAERRPLAAVLEAWLHVRARAAVEEAVACHAGALGVAPDRRSPSATREAAGGARPGRVG